MTLKKLVEKLPELVLTQEPLAAIFGKLSGEATLFFTDSHNFFSVCTFGRAVLVRNNDHAQVNKIVNDLDFKRAVAVGGCAALDVARACAKGRDVIIVPTILSTSCISVDRSVLSYNGRNRIEKTTMPSSVMVSIPALLNAPPGALARWTRSGFGDLFTMFSAAIELSAAEGGHSMKDIMKLVPECFEALKWVVEKFRRFDEECMKRLAVFLHESCLMVIRRNDTRLNAAGEHRLYHRLLELHREYMPSRPTHGQIVSAGTLIAARIFGEKTSDMNLYHELVTAYEKIGLPTNYQQLVAAGMQKKHLIEGLGEISDSGTYIGDYFKKRDFSILDRIFGALPANTKK